MADYFIKKPIRVLYGVLVKFNHFILMVDFVVLDCDINQEIPIILGRSFLVTRREIVDMEQREMKFLV